MSRRAAVVERLRTSTALLVLVSVAACVEGPQSVLDPHGTAAQRMATLHWILFVAGGMISVLVIAILLRAIFHTRSNEAPDEESALRWVLIAGAAVPAVVVSALFVYSAALLGALEPGRQTPVLRVEITGKQWWWHVQYRWERTNRTVTAANEIHIPTGQPVELVLRSTDVIHSFWVPELQGKTDLVPGRTTVTWLQADAPGSYRAQCAEYCGIQHARMALWVIAHEPADFERWLARESAPARPGRPPAGMQPDLHGIRQHSDHEQHGAQQPGEHAHGVDGQQVFMERGCAMCHTIRGTSARGRVGPDLTHVGSRRTIAAGTLPNTTGNLAGWIANPQVIKPGSHMPRLPVTSEELHGLVHFLENLK